MPSPKSRKFCFTWNNYPADHGDVLAAFGCRYYCYGYEEAPTTGTEHLQGFLYFDNQKSIAAMRLRIPGCDIRIANGTPQQNIVYCSKDGEFLEFGDRPWTQEEKGDSEITRYEQARDSAKSGDLDSIPADIFVRCYATLKRIELDYMPRVPSNDGTCGYWIYGLSGSGKTRSVYAHYPELYQKACNKWWDGYQGEEIVLVDDIDVYHVSLGSNIKHWADFCPFIAERKGGASRIRPRKVFVTSQYKIEEIWSDVQTQAALGRRFTVIEKIRDQAIIL